MESYTLTADQLSKIEQIEAQYKDLYGKTYDKTFDIMHQQLVDGAKDMNIPVLEFALGIQADMKENQDQLTPQERQEFGWIMLVIAKKLI